MATARALAKLEEMKAKNEIDEETYLRLKKEYEKKLKSQDYSEESNFPK